ncbi:MAG: class I SAM-dependent methyltransferase [Eubacteriales bacterium]|nr:class I SAM-dependent methyltransferase [Eubacteriales bacterium]
MNQNTQDFWETCWQRDTDRDYGKYLKAFYQKQDPMIDLFKRHHVRHVCDAACGYGAYSLMLASNGFQVEGFDISQTSVELTKKLLGKYGIDTSNYKAASVLDTGYAAIFDAVVAVSVLDHLYAADARAALTELLRIVKPGGLVVVSFDNLDEDDLKRQHILAADGSILYTDPSWGGMIFHPYADGELADWLSQYRIIHHYQNSRNERFYVIEKV